MQALWMVLGALIFATMGVCVKIASAWFTSAELVLYRGLIGIVFLVDARAQPGRHCCGRDIPACTHGAV